MFNDLMSKVKSNWASLLLIATLLTVGANFGSTFLAFNTQLLSLSEQIGLLAESTERIRLLEEQAVFLHAQLNRLEAERTEELYSFANSVLLVIDDVRIFEEQPISRIVMKNACACAEVKDLLRQTHGAEKVNSYCNYVTR